MATIHKLTKDGATIFPATITDAVVHPNTGKTLTSMMKDYNVSELFPAEGVDGGNKYNLALAIQVLGTHLTSAQKTGGIKLTFISSVSNCEEEYYLSKNTWSASAADWDQRFEVGDVVADPSGSWEPSTAEAYIDQKVGEINVEVAEEVITRQTVDSNLQTQINAEVSTRTAADNTQNGRIGVLEEAYRNLTESDVIVGPRPSTGQQANIIYREPDQSHNPPQFYSDYMWYNNGWVLMAQYDNGIDNNPTPGSNNLVKSGGVFNNMGGFDVSAYNSGAVYQNLTAALNAVPQSMQAGGMSIKFIQEISPDKYSVVKTEGLETEPTGTELSTDPNIVSGTYTASELSSFSTLPTTLNSSLTYYLEVTGDTTTYTTWVITYVHTSDNKYVQYRLVSDSWSTELTNWELDITKKNLSDDFLGLLSEIKDFPTSSYAITSQGNFGSIPTYKHAVLPVKAGEVYYLVGAVHTVRAAFATSDSASPGGDIPYVSGTEMIPMSAIGQYYKFVIPEGCTYFLFNALAGYGTRCYKHYDSLKEGTAEYTDDEPTADSDNLVKSGGVNKSIIEHTSLKYGEIVVKNTDIIKKRIQDRWKDDYYSILLHTIKGKQYIITAKDSNSALYCFLKSNDTTLGRIPDYATGYSNTVEIPVSKEISVTAPDDATWLYIYAGNSNGHRLPSHIALIDEYTLQNISDLNSKISQETASLRDIMISVDFEKIPKIYSHTFSIIENGTLGASMGYFHDSIPVKEGEILYLQNYGNTDNVRYCFATEEPASEALAIISLVEGTSVETVISQNIVKITVPTDCLLMYNSVSYSSALFKEKPIPLATLESDGLMSSEDKKGLLKIYVYEEIDLSDFANNNYYIDSSGIWKESVSKNNNCKFIPVTPGSSYRLNADRGRFLAWLKSDTITAEETADFCDGITSRIQFTDYNVYEAPTDAKYLYVVTYSTSNPTNISVSKVLAISEESDIINDRIDKETEILNNRIDEITTISDKKILCIGNSWGRDSFRNLWAVANAAGVEDLVIAQSYLGGSSLYSQYKGMDDPTLHYTHNGSEQYVQGTYQLWRYTSGTPVLTPSSDYNNGLCGVFDGTAYGKDSNGNWAAKTLQEILASEDWDIINIAINNYYLQSIDCLTTNNTEKKYFNILDFIARMEQELTPGCLAKVKWSISDTWSYPVECAPYYKPKGSILDIYNVDDWDSLTNEQKTAIYEQLYPKGQRVFQELAKFMGGKIHYVVSTAKALQLGRNSEWLGDVGFHMVRSRTDTHLAGGIPKYICACNFVYDYFGIMPNKIDLAYIPSEEIDEGTDGGSETNPTAPTRALCIGARKVAWQACCEMPDTNSI